MEEDTSPTRERLRAAVEKSLPDGRAGAFTSRWAAIMPARPRRWRLAPGCSFAMRWTRRMSCWRWTAISWAATGRGPSRTTKGFTDGRRIDEPGGKMNRLYVVENRYTVTGGMADHRLRIPASQVGAFRGATGRPARRRHGRCGPEPRAADAWADQGFGEFPSGLDRGAGQGSRGEPGQARW